MFSAGYHWIKWNKYPVALSPIEHKTGRGHSNFSIWSSIYSNIHFIQNSERFWMWYISTKQWTDIHFWHCIYKKLRILDLIWPSNQNKLSRRRRNGHRLESRPYEISPGEDQDPGSAVGYQPSFLQQKEPEEELLRSSMHGVEVRAQASSRTDDRCVILGSWTTGKSWFIACKWKCQAVRTASF